MFSTVRLRLTLWYVGVLAAVLVTFSIGVYSILGNSLRQRLDGNLRSAAEVAALALNHEIEEHKGQESGEDNVRLVLNTMHQTSFPRPYISIWDSGRLVAEKTGTDGVRAQVSDRLNAPAAQGPSFNTIPLREGTYRFISADVFVPSIARHYRVIANESLQAVEAELATLTEAFLISVPMCLLVAAGGGYLLVRKSLRPVLEMTRAAQQISSQNLEQRFSIANPRDELGFLAATFNSVFERLQQAFTQQRQFMADASHELRTPVSVALTAAQVSLRTPSLTTDELHETLEVVQSQMLRLRRVVDDMFTLAQAETGDYRSVVTRFYLDEVVSESVRAARVLGTAKNVDIQIEHTNADSVYEGDEGLIRQLLLIVLDNAIKFTGPGGSVSVALQQNEAAYLISVADTGSGISAVDQPHIFDRFYRADKSRSRREPGSGGGAGLGLSIAKWITELHRGSVRLARSDESGSVFVIELPRTPEPGISDARLRSDLVLR